MLSGLLRVSATNRTIPLLKNLNYYNGFVKQLDLICCLNTLSNLITVYFKMEFVSVNRKTSGVSR
jgi:hypothetical protein